MKTKPTIRLAFPLASAIAALLAMHSAQAQQIYWLGTTNGNFNADNWTAPSGSAMVPALVPVNGDVLNFEPSQASFNEVAGSFTLNNDLTLTGVSLAISDNSATGDFSISGNPISIGGSGIVSNVLTGTGTTLAFSGTGITLAAATSFNALFGALTINSPVDNGGNLLTVEGVGATSISGAITGAGGLTKINAGSLTLSSANTYTGQTTVTQGTVTASAIDALGTGAALLVNGGTLGISTFNNTVGAVTLTSGSITGTTGVLSGSSFALESGTASAILAGSGAVTKTTAGTVTLSGANTFSGQLTVQNGTLSIGTANNVSANGPLGNSALPVILGNTGAQTGILSYTGATATSTKPFTMATGGTGDINVTTGGTSLTLSGLIDGDGALTKSGAGTLELPVANSYSGGTTLAGGTVVIKNATSFGSGAVSVTANSRINSTAATGIIYANNIDIASTRTLSLQNTANTATTSFSGILTGSGTLTHVAQGTSNNTDVTIHFSNAANTFTGNINAVTSGNSADNISFASIGDGGLITIGRNAYRAGVIYNSAGSTPLSLGTRALAIGTGFGLIVNGNGVPVNRFQNNSSNAAATISFSQNMQVTTITSAGTFFFGGSNTGANTFSGNIGNPTSGGNLGIGKEGAGKWVLSGANSYLGNVLIYAGTLSVNAIDVASVDQPLGKGSLIQLGNFATNGTLEFTGTSTSPTDKRVQIGSTNNNHAGGGSILNNSTTDTLSFSNATFNPTLAVTTVDRTLTLGGSNTGDNTISGTIQDHVAGAAQILLTKTGDGTWVLGGNNTYTGATTVSGGTLVLSGVNTTTGATTVSAGTLVLANTAAVQTSSGISLGGATAATLRLATDIAFTTLPTIGGASGVGGTTFVSDRATSGAGLTHALASPNLGTNTFNFISGSNVTSGTAGITFAAMGMTSGSAGTTVLNPTTALLTITGGVTGGGSNVARTLELSGTGTGHSIGGVIANGVATAMSLTKSSTSTWTLTGASSYTGATTVNDGTLLVNSPGSLVAASAVTVNGGTLGGTGTIGGNVTVAAAGNLAPGASPGTLSITGNLDISAMAAGAGELKYELNALAGTNDLTAVTGTLTIGTLALDDLEVTNLGGLQAGTYTLITSAGITGTVDGTVDLIAPGFNGQLQINVNNVELVVTAAGGTTYASWIGGFAVGALNGVTDDPDFDGIDNGMEMVLGGNPATGMDTALMPTLELVTNPVSVPAIPAGDYLLFTYRRTAISEAALVAAACETDTDLVAPWTPAVNAVSSVVIQEDLNYLSFTPAAPADTDRVRVYVPRGVNTKLFGRLNVVVP